MGALRVVVVLNPRNWCITHSFRLFLQRLFKSATIPNRSRHSTDTVSRVSRWSATGNCEWRTCPRSLRCGQSGIRTHDPSYGRRRIYQCATTPHALVNPSNVYKYGQPQWKSPRKLSTHRIFFVYVLMATQANHVSIGCLNCLKHFV